MTKLHTWGAILFNRWPSAGTELIEACRGVISGGKMKQSGLLRSAARLTRSLFCGRPLGKAAPCRRGRWSAGKTV